MMNHGSGWVAQMKHVTLAAVVAVLGSATAFAAKNQGNDHSDLGIATHVDTGVVNSTVQCDVMRDYYFNVETGEWVGWASDPYITNCIEIGGSGGGTQCPPGDLVCQCQEGSNHPNCQGDGGDGGNDCKRSAPKARMGVAVGAHDIFTFAIPAETKVFASAPPVCGPGRCQDCRDGMNDAIAENEAIRDDCRHGWATETASARCEYGETRRGEDAKLRRDVFLNGGSGELCLGATGICTYVDGFEECVDGWLDGLSGHEIANSTSSSSGGTTTIGGKGSVPGFEVSGSHAVTFTDTNGSSTSTTLPPAAGLNDVCNTHANSISQQILADYNACVMTAPDKVNGSCNPVTNTNNGTN